MKRIALWLVSGLGGLSAAALANGCLVENSCGDYSACRGGRVGADAAGMDTCTDDGMCSTLGDAANADQAVDGVASDAANDSSREAPVLGDGDGAFSSELDGEAGWNAADGSGANDAGPDAQLSDANGAAPFVGVWTLSGTETSECPAVGSGPISENVSFSPGPGATESGEVDLLFDAGADCSLEMFVSGGIARLVSAPQPCEPNEEAGSRMFTSVQVGPVVGGSLQITETFWDETGCVHEVQDMLTQ